MSESRPVRGIWSPENWIVDLEATIVSATSEKNLFRKENLRDAFRGRRWRSTSAAQQKIVVKLATADLPQVIALIDCNAASGQTISVKQASDQAIATDVSTWDFTTYQQSKRRLLVWYPGDEDSGATPTERLYYEFTLPASGTDDSDRDGVADDYWEIGTIWMGDYRTLSMARIQTDVLDPSEVSVSDGGARFADPRPTFHELRISSEGIPEDDVFSIEDELDVAGVVRHILLDKYAAASGAAKKAAGAYYGTLGSNDTAGSFTRSLPQHESLGFSFVEARA